MKTITTEVDKWQRSHFQIFWGEIAPCDHLVQIYENDKTFLNTLEGDGLLNGESVVIIATREHLNYLNSRLITQNFDIETLIFNDQYIPLDAEECIAAFMVNDLPDEVLFTRMVTDIMLRAQKGNRKVRAFGEMVAILWAQGFTGATVRLENLWHTFQQQKGFCLYCAYPKSGFTEDANASINEICTAHSMVLNGETNPSTEILYKTVV